MEIPILMGVEGEAKDIIERYKAGICFIPEDKIDFIKGIMEINNPDSRSSYKEGCKRLASDFDRAKLAEDMREVLHNAVL